jgi:3-isopropylmalate/(R)-2-methylmalate dehydratase large subunit
MITYGTNPGMGTKVISNIPSSNEIEGSNVATFSKALEYMGFKAGEKSKERLSIMYLSAVAPMDVLKT